MTVRYELDGEIAVVTIDRPEVRNAVNRPTADALCERFLEFDRDDRLAVAILTGAAGTFCAGADLKGVADGAGNRVTRDEPESIVGSEGPMGPSGCCCRSPSSQPWRASPSLGAWSWRSGATCVSPQRMPSSVSTAGDGACH